MKAVIASLALTLALSLPALAQIKPAHEINVRGSKYTVTDVRAHSHKWKVVGPKSLTLNTVVVDKEGNQIEGYPVTVKVAELSKDDLKHIKDFRPLEQRRPFVHFVLHQGPNILLTALQFGSR